MSALVEASLATIGLWVLYSIWGPVPAFLFGFWGIVFLLRMIIKNQFTLAKGIQHITNNQ